MKCVNHPERLAEYTCAGCGKPFCSECIKIINNEPFCERCVQEKVSKEVKKEGMMFCSQCGKEIPKETEICPYCGEKIVGKIIEGKVAKQPKKTSGLAIASLVLGILFFIPFAPLLAIVFGIIALVKISKNKGKLKGRGMAIAGLILGGIYIIGILPAIALPRFMVQQRKAKEAAVWADLDAMPTAIEMYYLDCNSYPSGRGKGKKEAVGLDALIRNVEDRHGWAGPYMKYRRDADGDDIPEDPWGNEYEYEAPTSNAKEYIVWCKGEKGDYKAHYISVGDFNSQVILEKLPKLSFEEKSATAVAVPTAPIAPPARVTSIGSITQASIGQRATLKGNIVSVYVFRSGKVRTVKISDGTGIIDVLIWNDLFYQIPQRTNLNPGTTIQVSGEIGSYKGRLEIKPKSLGDIQILGVAKENPGTGGKEQ